MSSKIASEGDNDNVKKGKREEEQEKFRKRCDGFVQDGLQGDPTIQFLLQRLIQMGCTPPKGFIRCMDCGDDVPAAGGFGILKETIITKPSNASTAADSGAQGSNHQLQEDIKKRAAKEQCQRTKKDIEAALSAEKEGEVKLKLLPEIFLCQQHLRDEQHAREAIAHELTHAIDLCRTNMDPIKNCLHLACTEIRAENLSGECDWIREAVTGKMSSFPKHNQDCVKRRALLSVKANPNCKDHAEEAVRVAFERCYRDTFPFDRHPNLRH